MSSVNAHRRRAGAAPRSAPTSASEDSYKISAPALPARALHPRVLNSTTASNSTNNIQVSNSGPSNTTAPGSLPAPPILPDRRLHMAAMRSHTSTPPPPYTPGSYFSAQDDYTRSMLALSFQDTPMLNRSNYSPRPTSHEQMAHREASYSRAEVELQGPLHDRISTVMDYVITAMDAEQFDGEENELLVLEDEHDPTKSSQHAQPRTRETVSGRDCDRIRDQAVIQNPVNSNPAIRGHRHRKTKPPAYTVKYFAKSWLYANSRLQADLPAFCCLARTYRLLSIAAQYSLRAYNHQSPSERPHSSGVSIAPSHATFKTQYIPAKWRQGIKAMVLKIQMVDHCNTIVFAIRGSQNFMDWAVNLRHAPIPPAGFLDDPGNLVHSGFLGVAREMIAPVAARLRQLLTEDPNRANASLLITGHSAGGAVASLLYSHMQSQSSDVTSELKHLASFFQRVDCITFGTPPLSLLPLQKRDTPALRSSIFLAVINEGDPVVRADRGTIRSLLSLYASPSPPSNSKTYWLISPAELSNAGDLIVLRRRHKSSSRQVYDESNRTYYQSQSYGDNNNTRHHQTVDHRAQSRPEIGSTSTSVVPHGGRNTERGIEMVTTTDEQLRNVVFGDLLMHPMKLYAARIERLQAQAGY